MSRRRGCIDCRLLEPEAGLWTDGRCPFCAARVRPEPKDKGPSKLIVNMIGRTFGRLTVLRMVTREGRREKYYECACTCGGTIIAPGSYLRSGRTVSCNCYRRETASQRMRAWDPEIRRRAGRKTLAKRRAHALKTGTRLILNPDGYDGPRENGRWVPICRTPKDDNAPAEACQIGECDVKS